MINRIKSVRSIVIIFLLLCGSVSHAFTLDVGISAGSIAFRVDDKNGDTLGEMREELGTNIYLASRFKQHDGLWRNWGYFLEMGLGSYNIDTQFINNSEVNLGTYIHGKYAYLTWILYYKHHFKGDAYFAYGLGAGFGYLSANGRVKLTEETGQPVISVDVSDFSGSAGIYAEYFRKKWFVRLAAYGPNYTDEPYQFGVSDARIIYGHRFEW